MTMTAPAAYTRPTRKVERFDPEKVASVLRGASPFLKTGWKLMSDMAHEGITKPIYRRELRRCASDPASSGKRVGTRAQYRWYTNALRNLSIRGLLLHSHRMDGIESMTPALAESAYRAVEQQVPVLAYLNREEAKTLVAQFRTVTTLTKARSVWDAEQVHLRLGNRADAMLKALFDRGAFTGPVVGPPVYRDVANHICAVLDIVPVCGDLKVAAHDRPMADPDGPYHSDCKECLRPPPAKRQITAVDLVGTSPTQVVLVEFKTYKGLSVDRDMLQRYSLQTWLTWVMFALTYRTHYDLHRITARIVVLLPATNMLLFYHVPCPRITRRLVSDYPFLGTICREKLRALTPCGTGAARVRGAFCAVDLSTGKRVHPPSVASALRGGRRSKKAILKPVAQKKVQAE